MSSQRLRWVRLSAVGVALGAALLLLGALGFQYLADLAPCPLCVYQRVPHALAIPLALAALLSAPRGGITAEALLAAAGLVIAAGAGLALYHVGIEERWWAGPTACSGAGLGLPSTVGDLERALSDTPIVACDTVAWSLFGISLAGFNAIFSTLLAGLALLPIARRLFERKSDAGAEKAEKAQVV